MIHYAGIRPVSDCCHGHVKLLPVGWTNFPLPIGMGFDKVRRSACDAVQCPFAILIGCSVILRSGSATNSAFNSRCLSIPRVSWPSGQLTMMPARRFLQAIPVLIAEDIEIRGVERH